MQTALKMPLSSLSPSVVQDLQKKYPEAECTSSCPVCLMPQLL